MPHSNIDTPLKVLSWLSQNAVQVIWHQKRKGQPERVILIFTNPRDNSEARAKGFTLSEAVAMAEKIIDRTGSIPSDVTITHTEYDQAANMTIEYGVRK